MDSPKPRRKAPTQATIARLAGVSQEAVSHILGGKRAHLFSEETRNKVEETARKIGYQPHQGARLMRKGRSNLIILLNMGGFSEVVEKMTYNTGRFVHEHGYDYQSINAYWWVGDGNQILERVISLRPEGVIIAGTVQADMDFNLFHQSGIPFVWLAGQTESTAGMVHVQADVQSAFKALTTHAIQQGSKRPSLLMVRKDPVLWQSSYRLAGFLEAIQEAGLPEPRQYEYGDPLPTTKEDGPVIFLDSHRADKFRPFQAGMECAAWIGNYPDALICTNDDYALGAMNHYQRRGISVPQELMVSGFDNLFASVLGNVSLTTVEQPTEQMCVASVQILFDMIKGKTSPGDKVFPCEIIWRESMPAQASNPIQSHHYE